MIEIAIYEGSPVEEIVDGKPDGRPVALRAQILVQAEPDGEYFRYSLAGGRNRKYRVHRCFAHAPELCPGCSSIATEVAEDGVATCPGCGGWFTPEPVSTEVVASYIDLSTMSSGPCERYFDFLIDDSGAAAGRRRVHGFADAQGRVAQFG